MSGSTKSIKVECWYCHTVFEKMIETEIVVRPVEPPTEINEPPMEIVVLCSNCNHPNKVDL
jgi:hypothetical protein